MLRYNDWRDQINPDLLYRLWGKKGKPGAFLRYTPYGISIVIVAFQEENIYLSANSIVDMVNPSWRDWNQQE